MDTAIDFEGNEVSESIPVKPKSRVWGTNVVFGVQEPKPIVGAPVGKWRLRMRNKSFARLFVKTTDGIRCFALEDFGDRWFANPKLEQGRNIRK